MTITVTGATGHLGRLAVLNLLDRGVAIPFTVPRPRLPGGSSPALPTSGDFGYVDTFRGDRLAMQWIGIRTPKQPFARVAAGTLALWPGAKFGDLSGAALATGTHMTGMNGRFGGTSAITHNAAQTSDAYARALDKIAAKADGLPTPSTTPSARSRISSARPALSRRRRRRSSCSRASPRGNGRSPTSRHG